MQEASVRRENLKNHISPRAKRTGSSVHAADEDSAADVSPGKKLHISMHASDAAGIKAFQQQAWDIKKSLRHHTSWEQQEATIPQEHKASRNKQLQHWADARQQQPAQAVDVDQLQAVHAAYIAALQSGKQQHQNAAAKADSLRHEQRQHQLPQHAQQQLSHMHQQQKQQLPAADQHALQWLMPPPQCQHHQQACQQLFEQQQALAAYQAALGRPAVQPASKLAQDKPQQHTCARGLIPELQTQHAQSINHQQLLAHLPQQAQEGCRKALGSMALPCNAAQAQNVYKAFQWQKDAIEYADACNRSAAGLNSNSREG